MRILFEDSDEAPSSLLLKSCSNGNNIYFSNGAGKLAREMSKHLKFDTLLVFMDVVPNNKSTINLYNSLNTDFEDDIDNNRLLIIPIICIEYIILTMLIKWNYIQEEEIDGLHYLITDFNYSELSSLPDVRNNTTLQNSLEKICKYFLNNIKHKCMKNGFEYKSKNNIKQGRDYSSIKGIFYETDCHCGKVRDDYCSIESSLIEKADRLYITLPVFDVINDEHKSSLESLGVSIVKYDINDKLKDIQNFYNNICSQLGDCEFTVKYMKQYKKELLRI